MISPLKFDIMKQKNKAENSHYFADQTFCMALFRHPVQCIRSADPDQTSPIESRLNCVFTIF